MASGHCPTPARCERRTSHTGEELSHTCTVGDGLSITGEDQSSDGEESSHTGEELAAEARVRMQ